MWEDLAILFLAGTFAGTLGGLLGIGGGIVVMPLLRFVFGLSPAHAAGTCVLAVFFTTLGGSYRHYRLGNVHLKSIASIMVSGSIATVFFSLIFSYLSVNERWLDLAIGLVFSIISLRMIAEGIPGLVKNMENNKNNSRINGKIWQKISIGSMAGALPGLLGIGTGVVLVPAFIYGLGAPVKIAMASSLTCFSVNAFISSAIKYAQGFMDPGMALPLSLGTLIGANLGAMLSNACSSRILRIAFGLVFSYVSLKFILAFAG